MIIKALRKYHITIYCDRREWPIREVASEGPPGDVTGRGSLQRQTTTPTQEFNETTRCKEQSLFLDLPTYISFFHW